MTGEHLYVEEVTRDGVLRGRALWGEVTKAGFACLMENLEARLGNLRFIIWIPGCHK